MFADPKQIISQSFVAEGMIVADFGVGAGFYTIPLAQKVGEYGKIYAVDIQQDHLSKVRSDADHLGLHNIEVIHGDLEKPFGSGLPQAFVDRVFISNVLFQTERPADMIAEAKRILKRTGKIIIVEWAGSFDQMGPHPDHVIGRPKILSICKDLGLSPEKDLDVGTHHFGLLLRISG